MKNWLGSTLSEKFVFRYNKKSKDCSYKNCRPQADTAAAAKSLQSCPTLCDPIDGSPPGSAVPGILQARTLERAAISFSSAWKWKVKVKSLSHVRLFMTLGTAAYQAPPSIGFSRQEYWSGMPFPSQFWSAGGGPKWPLAAPWLDSGHSGSIEQEVPKMMLIFTL